MFKETKSSFWNHKKSTNDRNSQNADPPRRETLSFMEAESKKKKKKFWEWNSEKKKPEALAILHTRDQITDDALIVSHGQTD